MRSIKGLTNVIGMTVAHPTYQKTREGESHMGWAFSTQDLHNGNGFGCFNSNEAQEDPIHNFKYVRDIYESQGSYTGIF